MNRTAIRAQHCVLACGTSGITVRSMVFSGHRSPECAHAWLDVVPQAGEPCETRVSRGQG